jgi:hypothetical protein
MRGHNIPAVIIIYLTSHTNDNVWDFGVNTPEASFEILVTVSQHRMT